ncbi:MAG: PHP domain-containing protein [Clostridiales bacterium]|nr:PHP domain-containing protein [Clostridiales bacterium]
MIFQEPLYDLDELARYNLHVHTVFSLCAKAPALLFAILKAAQAARLKGIALTDHFNDDISSEQYMEHIRLLKQEAERFNTSELKVYYGAELSAYEPGKSLESESLRQSLDYRLYTVNHFHLNFWGHPKENTPAAYALYMLDIMRSFILTKKAHCFAHPFIGRFIHQFEDQTLVTKALSDNQLGDIFCLAKKNGVAWEINSGAIIGDPEFARRYWNLGRECGVTFHYGTDAHHPDNVDTAKTLPLVKKILL